MTIKILDEEELALDPVQSGSETDIPRSKIIIANKKVTDKIVDGVVLEAAIGWHGYYLLFTTNDVPYEEMLNIQLLDKNLKLIDSAVLGAIYSTGSFSSLNIIDANTISFQFIGDTDWTIELLQKPIFSIPFFTEPKGVSRKLRFSKHFTISGKPRPQTAG